LSVHAERCGGSTLPVKTLTGIASARRIRAEFKYSVEGDWLLAVHPLGLGLNMLSTALKAATAAGVVIALSGIHSATASAYSTGLDGLHDKRREGGRICLVDHTHEGTGSGSSKKAAEMAAIKAWAEFTAWEYGYDWGSFNKSASKKVACSGGGTSWSCRVESRPCRSG
jgi:hypothetical protein